MENLTSLIIGSSIALISSIITLIVNNIFNACINKRATDERLFYYLIPKRLELYNELGRTVSEFTFDYSLLYADTFSISIAQDSVLEFTDKLGDLRFRVLIYGSKELNRQFRELLATCTAFYKMPLIDDSKNSDISAKKIYDKFLTTCDPICNELLEQVRIEAGTETVDKIIFDILEKPRKETRKNVRKQSKEQSNKAPCNQIK